MAREFYRGLDGWMGRDREGGTEGGRNGGREERIEG